MATISVSLPSDGQTIDAADYNVPINTIVSAINGNLDSNNISAGGVATSNLATGIQSSTKESVPYKFSVYRNTAWTTATSATVVQFDTKVYDTGTNVDVATNKGRFTAPIAGFYFFSATVRQTTGSGAPLYIQLFKNGSQALSGTLIEPTVADNAGHISGMLSLAANDYVEVYWTGGAGSSGATGADKTWFQGFLLSAT